MACYDTALRLFPYNIDILNGWAQALIIKGDLAEAGNRLELSISLDPDRAETYFIYGFLYSGQGNSEKAASICLETVNNNPRNLRSFMNICQDMAQAGMIRRRSMGIKMKSTGLPRRQR